MATEAQKNINDVARVLIAVTNVQLEPGLESERALVDEVKKLDRDGLNVVIQLARTILLFGGEQDEEENDGND